GVSYALSDKWLNHWYMKQVVTGFLANSHATYQAMTQTFPEIIPYPSLTLNNGIALPDPRPVLQTGIQGRIGMVARLSTEKGIPRALETLNILKSKSVPAELWIIGEGPERVPLENQALKMGLGDSVQFLGFREDVLELLATCQVFLFTPHFGEGTSLALIEAMAVGLPCLAFDTPAMNEVIIDQQTGYLLEDGDVEGMATKIELLLSQKDLCIQLGEKAQGRAYAEFSLKNAADKVTHFLQSL
ncbi:MAG: glycosyltransferase, partial [Bacteroidota bacterium]